MFLHKCKNSVFCVFFLLCFFVGTICGTLIFRIIFNLHGAWVGAYYADLYRDGENSFFCLFASCLRPLVSALLLGSLSYRKRLIPALIALRGCGISYFLCFAICAQCRILPVLVTEITVLAAFFCVCHFLYFDYIDDAVLPVLDWRLILFIFIAAGFTSFIQFFLL